MHRKLMLFSSILIVASKAYADQPYWLVDVTCSPDINLFQINFKETHNIDMYDKKRAGNIYNLMTYAERDEKIKTSCSLRQNVEVVITPIDWSSLPYEEKSNVPCIDLSSHVEVVYGNQKVVSANSAPKNPSITNCAQKERLRAIAVIGSDDPSVSVRSGCESWDESDICKTEKVFKFIEENTQPITTKELFK